MTQSPQPGEILTSDSVKLLKAGDVLRHAIYGPVEFLHSDGKSVATDRVGDWPERFTFVRLAAPSVERKPLTPIDYLVEALSPPKPDVAGARERLLTRLDGGYIPTIPMADDVRLILSAYDRQGEEIERLRGALERVKTRTTTHPDDTEADQAKDAKKAHCIARDALAARASQGGPDHG